jgi:hypothetical protein
VPPRTIGLIGRRRLLTIASQLPAKRLTVIKAPTGFGKTSAGQNGPASTSKKMHISLIVVALDLAGIAGRSLTVANLPLRY